MKLYTQTGDGGKTSLLSGERVDKSNLRIHAYGEIDELNAVTGALIAALPPGVQAAGEELRQIQADLFQVGAWLAATPDAEIRERLAAITPEHSRRLEAHIDAMDAQLPELRSFILPGGHPAAAWAHIARTVCRRAERTMIALTGAAAADDRLAPLIAYVNRLSDYFFMLARLLNSQAGVADVTWRG